MQETEIKFDPSTLTWPLSLSINRIRYSYKPRIRGPQTFFRQTHRHPSNKDYTSHRAPQRFDSGTNSLFFCPSSPVFSVIHRTEKNGMIKLTPYVGRTLIVYVYISKRAGKRQNSQTWKQNEKIPHRVYLTSVKTHDDIMICVNTYNVIENEDINRNNICSTISLYSVPMLCT